MIQSGSGMEALKSIARRACSAAYAPYSHFHVGAAVSDATGLTFPGCNMENASYGLTQCAERNAIAAAVVAGIRDLRAVLIYTPGNRVHAPCGACRQVIGEMMHPAARVISCCDSDEYSEWTVGELLPEPFEPEALLNP